MGTWKARFDGREVLIHATKDEARAMSSAVQKVLKIDQYHRELSGVIGEEEHGCELWTLGMASGVPLVDEAAYEVDKAALLASIGQDVTAAVVPTITAAARAVFQKHLPVVDKRLTREAKNAEDAERTARETASASVAETRVAEWAATWCNSADKVRVPDGNMAVVIQMTYDNSDSMTDYYSPHCSYGEAMLLGIVRKGARTEVTARRLLGGYAELAKLEWKWKSQTYSGGHGNFLTSTTAAGVAEGVTTYGGDKNPSCVWEISFERYRCDFLPFRGYPGTGRATAAKLPTERPTGGGNGSSSEEERILEANMARLTDGGGPVAAAKQTAGTAKPTVAQKTVTENDEKNGIEVRFPARPADSVLTALKSAGWRWSRFAACWYNRRSEANRAFAESL